MRNAFDRGAGEKIRPNTKGRLEQQGQQGECGDFDFAWRSSF